MNKRRAFTLIELLVVITIMLLLVTLLMPAIFKARLAALGMEVRNQIKTLVYACQSYQTSFDGSPPGVLANPIGAPLSGCQSLRLALLGGTRNGATYSPLYDGPYDDSKAKKYDPFYKPKSGELLTHAQIQSKDPNTPYNFNGYDPSVDVVVDAALKPARPLLYYRKRFSGPIRTASYPFDFGENAVYCAKNGEIMRQSGTYDYYGTFHPSPDDMASFIGSTGMGAEFIIISAGVDRQYFTKDDILSFVK